MKKKVAVYFRCSTGKQDKSIADQRAVISNYAVSNGLQIVAWFDKDKGKSGTSHRIGNTISSGTEYGSPTFPMSR